MAMRGRRPGRTKARDVLWWHGRREVPALPGVAAQAAQPGELGVGLNGFGGHGSQDVGQPDDGGDDFQVHVVGCRPDRLCRR